MKLDARDSHFGEKLTAIKSRYRNSSFKEAVTPNISGRKWQYIGELEGTLTDTALKSLRTKTLLKIIFSLGIAFCFKSVRRDFNTVQSSSHKEIKPIFISLVPDPSDSIAKMKALFNERVHAPVETLLQHTTIPPLPKMSKEEVLAKLQVASLKDFPAFQDDEEVVRKAVERFYTNFEFASDRLKGSKSFVKVLIEVNAGALQFASPELKDAPDLAELGMAKDAGLYPYLGPNQRKRREFAERGVNYGYDAVMRATAALPEELKSDKELAKRALLRNASCIIHFEPLLNDRAFFLNLLKTCTDPDQCINVYQIALPKAWEKDPEFLNIMKAKNITVKEDGTFLIDRPVNTPPPNNLEAKAKQVLSEHAFVAYLFLKKKMAEHSPGKAFYVNPNELNNFPAAVGFRKIFSVDYEEAIHYLLRGEKSLYAVAYGRSNPVFMANQGDEVPKDLAVTSGWVTRETPKEIVMTILPFLDPAKATWPT
jgi:hypothetical protein